MCQSVDQLDQAVGDPTTGLRSAAWQDLETALTGGDEERLKAAANGVLGHLTEGSRQAATAARFTAGSGAASELQALHDGLADGVRTMRDGTLEASVQRVNEGRNLVDAAYEGPTNRRSARCARCRSRVRRFPAGESIRSVVTASSFGVECSSPLAQVTPGSVVGADVEHPRANDGRSRGGQDQRRRAASSAG